MSEIMNKKGIKNKFGLYYYENWMGKKNPFHNFAKLLMNTFIKEINRDSLKEAIPNLE